ncbi:hypothetical protein LX32DRAFT_48956 [Colletotrichum zoysiae]|uniref:Uncharacterized protein n=1 Tax=Colletotrichum zoysiae TaxID=1216348 RepID=A0AAD9HD15_9PEZI|nr:hypothetical protein LX32DRAFT_48956 [Colletotrichum zoysiae]
MVYRHSPVDVDRMPLDRPSAKQPWQGVTDPKLRRQLQNRENQRLSQKLHSGKPSDRPSRLVAPIPQQHPSQFCQSRQESNHSIPISQNPWPCKAMGLLGWERVILPYVAVPIMWRVSRYFARQGVQFQEGSVLSLQRTPIWSTPILSGSSNIPSPKCCLP